ncbi:efflux RND transporter periplasmic adaptor subunit [Paenibacillus thalictri]|uniref:HlyD family efflux transporter periplasmic adaptor subunit n=1 Tax=Paenibacillus thalictri TaxID=2527873 RepID=A0A4Q9DRS6_9BACL|nr:efflux RND transporter periplasmic adaptor subunit [Paenibacillus thalictri]TBL78351.1 HlyD family efflux transporter periplasmic adaptor subunit [Paenibacillus thalictri]
MNTKMLLVNVIVILLIIAGLGAAVYYYNQSANYISTDNAHVDGQQVTIAATTSGKLTDWSGQVGKTFNSGERVGSVTLLGQPTPTKVDIEAPVSGTIVQQSVVPNSFVSAGSALARAYDLNSLWVTANIEEKNFNNVKLGQTVDVYVDAFPGTVLSGRVDKIGLTTTGTFSLMPSSNTNANYTKVAQVLPVTIVLDGYKGVALAPGMSVTVRIHI